MVSSSAGLSSFASRRERAPDGVHHADGGLGGRGGAGDLAILLFPASYWAGLSVSILAFALIGLGAGAAAHPCWRCWPPPPQRDGARRRQRSTWLMMIFGIAVTAGVVGTPLDPLFARTADADRRVVTVGAVVVTAFAIHGIERSVRAVQQPEQTAFLEGLSQVWAERGRGCSTIFVFLSMTAYFMQELILEPYAGLSSASRGPVHAAVRRAERRRVPRNDHRRRALPRVLVLGYAAALGHRGLPRVGGGAVGDLRHRPAGLATLLVPAVVRHGLFQRHVRGRGHRLDDGHGGEGRERPRARAWAPGARRRRSPRASGGLTGAALADVMRTVLPDALGLRHGFRDRGRTLRSAAALMAAPDHGSGHRPQLVPGE